MTPTRKASSDPLAVIDIGSNSARLVIYHREPSGQLRILGNARASLRLVSDVDRNRRLSAEAIAATLRVLADFHAMIQAHGVRRTVAVATAAMRDADNGKELIERARVELGLRIELIDSSKEAHYGSLGGIRGLPVNHGILFDLGGGSLQIARFRNRRPGSTFSLPLGSLRMSQAFLRHDPPSKREVRDLRNYIRQTFNDLDVPRLRSKDVLVGVGGTIRNLAKVDARLQKYPIMRVHGYSLTRARLNDIVDFLCRKAIRSDRSVAGLSRERGDSILGGALAIEELMDVVGAKGIVVSGEGIREGLAYSLAEVELPSPEKVQSAAILSLANRFSTWDPDWARRRAQIAAALLKALAARVGPDTRTTVEHAAILLDIGRSVDFFNRYEHAAAIVMDTELDGFSHHQIALLSTIIASAGNEDADTRAYKSLLDDIKPAEIERVTILLRLADEILQRSPRNGPIAVKCRVGRREIRIAGPGLGGWTPRGIASRFERSFKRRLIVRSL